MTASNGTGTHEEVTEPKGKERPAALAGRRTDGWCWRCFELAGSEKDRVRWSSAL